MLGICSCSSTSVSEQGKVIGTLNAGIKLPNYPTECREITPHADVKEGDDAVVLLVRERGQLDKANSKGRACGPHFYDNVKAGFTKQRRKEGDNPLPKEMQQ